MTQGRSARGFVSKKISLIEMFCMLPGMLRTEETNSDSIFLSVFLCLSFHISVVCEALFVPSFFPICVRALLGARSLACSVVVVVVAVVVVVVGGGVGGGVVVFSVFVSFFSSFSVCACTQV